jgi:hypothetical protein
VEQHRSHWPFAKAYLKSFGWAWWLKTGILAIWEAKMGRIMVGGQSGQNVCESPSQAIIGPNDTYPSS